MRALSLSSSNGWPAAVGRGKPRWLRKRNLAAFLLLFLLILPRSGLSQPHSLALSFQGRRVEVKIIARGSSMVSSTGNMDIYLAIISNGRHDEPIAARLVYYYPFFASGLSADQMASGHPFHLRLSYAGYCGMEAKDFAVQQALDSDAVTKLIEASSHDVLPCFVVRH